MANVIAFPERARKADAIVIPIATPQLDEHACTRQARILNAWLLDSAADADIGIDWTIERLKQALRWAEMRRLFTK